MTHYHPATESLYKHHLQAGFLSLSTLRRADLQGLSLKDHRVNTMDLECRTLACASHEDAVAYGEAYYGPGIELKIIEIEGEYPCYPITGTMVPDGTMFLLGEIAAENVRLSEPAPELTAASPSP